MRNFNDLFTRLKFTKTRIHYALSFYAVLVSIASLVAWRGNQYPFYMTIISYYALTIYLLGYFKFPQNVNNVLYAFALTMHVIVPLVFWTMLKQAFDMDVNPFSRFVTFLVHGLDFVLILIHFFMFKNPLPAISILWNAAIIMVYVGWAWIGYAITGIFVYPFIDFQNPFAMYAYPGLFILNIMVSSAWVFIHRYRDRRINRVGSEKLVDSPV